MREVIVSNEKMDVIVLAYARKAFNAYQQVIIMTGGSQPEWDMLTEPEQCGWAAAAETVLSCVLTDEDFD